MDPTQPAEIVQKLAAEMPSPYCPGRTISTCSSHAARALEEDMLAQAQSGASIEQIEANLVDRFGTEVMGTPLRADIVLAATLGAFAVCALLVARGRKWTRSTDASSSVGANAAAGTAGAATAAAMSAEDQDRVDDALDEIDEF